MVTWRFTDLKGLQYGEAWISGLGLALQLKLVFAHTPHGLPGHLISMLGHC